MTRVVAVLALCALAAGCTTTAPLPPRTAATSACRDFLAELDARIDRAGVRDGGAHRVDGYPYLRADRYLASFADDVGDDRRFSSWVEALRQRDMAARRAEIANLDASQAADLSARADDCGRKLAAMELGRPELRAPLRERVAVPDDYSEVARGLGLYPVTRAFLESGVRHYQDGVRSDYAQRVESLEGTGQLSLWSAQSLLPDPAPMKRTLDKPFAVDALGVPQPDAAQWQALLQRHAPAWWIEDGGAFDQPAALRFDAHDRVVADPAQGVVYYLTGHTRFGARVLPVLVYAVWFSERPPLRRLDPYSGKLDGVIWRVVLDERGEVIAYDTIHSCGCYRYHFPVQALTPLAAIDADTEPPLLPQGRIAAGAVAVRLQTATHYVRRAVPERSAHGRARSYRLVPYEALLSLPRIDGSRRSAFAQDGMVAGSERLERWWLWPSGVRDAGAMRQFGRHATAFVGEQHFDDARFLEQVYAAPQ